MENVFNTFIGTSYRTNRLLSVYAHSKFLIRRRYRQSGMIRPACGYAEWGILYEHILTVAWFLCVYTVFIKSFYRHNHITCSKQDTNNYMMIRVGGKIDTNIGQSVMTWLCGTRGSVSNCTKTTIAMTYRQQRRYSCCAWPSCSRQIMDHKIIGDYKRVKASWL